MLGFWFMAMIERWVFLQSRPWSVSRAKETVGKFSQSTYDVYIIHKSSSSTKHIFPQHRLMQLNLFPYCYKTHVTIGPKDFRDLSLDQQILHNFRVDWELIILSHDPPAQGTDTSLVIHLCWSQGKNALNIPALSLSLFTTLQEACSPWNLWSLPWFLLALQLLVYLTAEGFQAVIGSGLPNGFLNSGNVWATLSYPLYIPWAMSNWASLTEVSFCLFFCPCSFAPAT